MLIRLATTDDKAKVLALLDELGEEINKKDGPSPRNAEAQAVGAPLFDEVVSRKDTLIFVADDNEMLLGLVSFYIIPNIQHGSHRGHIEDFVVSEAARGRDVGTKLFDAVKAYCKEHCIQVIKLDSGLPLVEAHAFYEKIGGKFTEKMFRFDIGD
jgi:ribosomal protein S18 acetylase RimI-like enzyme